MPLDILLSQTHHMHLYKDVKYNLVHISQSSVKGREDEVKENKFITNSMAREGYNCWLDWVIEFRLLIMTQ